MTAQTSKSSSSTSHSASSPDRPERLFKVRFEGGGSGQESPRSRWRRLGHLSLLRQGRGHRTSAPPPSRTVVAISEPEDSSSNSTPEGRLIDAEMAASTRSQATAGGNSSSSQAAASSRERKRKSLERSSSSARFCLFGVIHVETGARLFLLFYVLLSACGVAFGSVALMVWILVPLVVVPLAGYSLSRHASKYLYPFLVISVIHSLVALLMVLIVACFSLLCFDQLKAHFAAKSLLSSTSLLAFSPPTAFSSASFTALICALAMALSLGMALLFFWQSLVLFSCIGHFDLLAQQGRQQQQQIQQQMLKESKLQQSKNSAPADQRPMANGGGGGPTTVSRQLECSQCISEIRQLGQFSATNERWNRPP